MPSSVVAHIHYDPGTSILRITFTSGEKYDYIQVPANVYEDMKKAFSKGDYLNKVIKPHYAYKKVTPGWKAQPGSSIYDETTFAKG